MKAHLVRYKLALPAIIFFHTACGGNTNPIANPDVIDRDTFITVFVDLRLAAVESEDFVITDSARDQILSSHGIDSESLVLFADVYGSDVEFMRDVWNDVERLFGERTTGDFER